MLSPHNSITLPYSNMSEQHTRDEMIQRAREENHEMARRFYQVDQSLSTEDRNKLAGIFWKGLYLVPLGTLPFVVLGIQFPRIAAQRKLMFQKSYRGWQVVFGFVGLVVGGRASAAYANWYARSSLDEGSNPRKAFDILSRYPPQVGMVYYQKSARDPAWLMRDPDAPGQDGQAAGFPLSLALHGREAIRQERMASVGAGPKAGAPGSSPFQRDQQSRPQQQQQDSSFSSDDPFELSTPIEPTENSGTSTWDKIRAQNSAVPGTAPIPPMGRYRPPPQAHREKSNEPVRGEVVPIAPAESQGAFDKELERERQGGGVPDDFTDSEKKWS